MSIFFVASQRGGTGVSTVAAHIAALSAHHELDTLFVAVHDTWQLELFFSAAEGKGRVTPADAGDLWDAAARAGEQLHVCALHDAPAPSAIDLLEAADAARDDGVIIADVGVLRADAMASLTTRARVLNVLRADAASVISVTAEGRGDDAVDPDAVFFCVNQFDPRVRVSRDVEIILSGKLGGRYLGRITADAAIPEAAADGAVLDSAQRKDSQALRDLDAITQSLLSAAGLERPAAAPVPAPVAFAPARDLSRASSNAAVLPPSED